MDMLVIRMVVPSVIPGVTKRKSLMESLHRKYLLVGQIRLIKLILYMITVLETLDIDRISPYYCKVLTVILYSCLVIRKSLHQFPTVMLRIRLQRVGTRNQPHFRIVVTEKTTAAKRSPLAVIGQYRPDRTPKLLLADTELANLWLSRGAQPTDTVHNLLVDLGILKTKRDIRYAKAPTEVEETPVETGDVAPSAVVEEATPPASTDESAAAAEDTTN